MQECSVSIYALTNKVQIFFHLVDMNTLGDFRSLSGLIQPGDIFLDILQTHRRWRSAGKQFTALAENPWIADGVTTDHYTRSFG